jgi:hypothetical protein
MNIVPIKKSNTAISEAKALLSRCEAGDVVAFTVIEEQPNGTYSVTGSATASRTASAGMLLDAAITRLKDGE